MQTAARKLAAFRSYRVATRLTSFNRQIHAFDGVAIAVEERRKAVLPFSVGLGPDVRHRAVALDSPPDRVAVVTLVAVQDFTRRKPREKLGARHAIGDIAAGEHEGDGATARVGQRVDFGRASAA